jgi:hypothetical protein
MLTHRLVNNLGTTRGISLFKGCAQLLRFVDNLSFKRFTENFSQLFFNTSTGSPQELIRVSAKSHGGFGSYPQNLPSPINN